MKNLDLLIPTEETANDLWTWATVTQASPLRIRLDGDTAALVITPECLFYGPKVGERVWVQVSGLRVIVHARHTGGAASIPAGDSLLPYGIRGGNKSMVLNLNTSPEVLNNGFWSAAPGSSNVPPGGSDWHYGWTLTHDTGAWVTQFCQPFSGGIAFGPVAQLWTRKWVGGAWQPWRTFEAQAQPISRHNASVYRATNLPNDGIVRQTQFHDFGVPASHAVQAVVSMSVNAHCVANAQVAWYPYVRTNNAEWHLIGGSHTPIHNHGNASLNMGASWTGVFDIRTVARNGGGFQMQLQGSNDPGSGAWLDVGAMNATVTYLGPSTLAL